MTKRLKKKRMKQCAAKLQQKKKPQQCGQKQKSKQKGQLNGQCPQGNNKKKKRQQKKARQLKRRRKIKKLINKLEAIKDNEKSLVEIFLYDFLNFYYNKRFIELFYCGLFALITPLCFIFLNATFVILKSLKLVTFNLPTISCIIFVLLVTFSLLYLAAKLQHLLVKSTKSNRKVNIVLFAIIAFCLVTYPQFISLPLFQKITPYGDIIMQIIEFLM